MNDKQLTVYDLIEQLKKLPPGAPVWVEGTETTGQAEGVELVESDSEEVMIRVGYYH